MHTLYNDGVFFLSEYDRETIAINVTTLTVALFILFQLIDLIRTGRYRVTHILRNAAAAAGAAAILTSVFFLGEFFMPRMYASVTTMTAPGRNLLIVVVLAIVLFMFPRRFWQALKQAISSPRRFDLAVSERFRMAVEARTGSYPPPAPLAQNTDLAFEEIPIAADGGPMLLKLKKSQTTSLWGNVIFMIDARMQISAREHDLIRKYRLGDHLIYSSTAREKHRQAASAGLESTKGHPGFTASAKDQLMGVLKMLFSFAIAGAHATMAAYHLKITVYKLLRGVHVRCKNMNEVLVAKNAIVEAGQNLRTYLDVAQSFDGTEEIHEF